MIQVNVEISQSAGSGRARSARIIALIALVGLCGTLGPATAAPALEAIEVKAGYRQILGVLATGDLEGAVVDLVEFEQSVVGEQEDAWRYTGKFWRFKLNVIRELLDSQPVDVLMPIILLHHDAYLEYSRLDRRHLAHHSRQMASELAEIYAQEANTQKAREFSGWVLTSFAANVWLPTSMGGSANLFYRSYLVDPGNQVALFGLAAAYERSGDYEKAIEYLRQALRIDPENSEVGLRLALCLIRSEPEPPQVAISNLTVLTGEAHPTWIRSVAYQELAKIWIQNGREDEAESLVRKGLGELPGDPQLSLQLAAMLDRQRRRDEAVRTLDAIAADGRHQDSPRQRYAVWAPTGMDEVRVALREEMKQGLSALGAGLQVAPTEEVEE